MLKIKKATLYCGGDVFTLTGGEAPCLTRGAKTKEIAPDDPGDLAFMVRDADFEEDEPAGDRLILATDAGVKILADTVLLADAARYLTALWNGTRELYVLRLESFDGGGPAYEAEMQPSGIVTWTRQKIYRDPNHEELCGAGFEVVYTFRPLRPGQAKALVTGRAFYGEEPPRIIDFTVDEELHLTHRDSSAIPQP